MAEPIRVAVHDPETREIHEGDHTYAVAEPGQLYVAIHCDACDDHVPIATAYVSPGSVLSLPDHVCAPQPVYALADALEEARRG